MKYLINFSLASILSLLFLNVSEIKADAPPRPEVWGIAKMTFRVSDLDVARDYYGDFLGFDEAFSYDSEDGKVISFKVNDRQFLEFVEVEDFSPENNLISVSFETEDVDMMKKYLSLKGIKIVDENDSDGAGNKVCTVQDPSGISVEYLEFSPGSLHRKSEGKYLGNNRISKRIHHVGLYSSDEEKNNKFYKDILGFKDMWRYESPDGSKIYVYLHMPDCVENIEYALTGDRNANHPCFLVEDMQETIYTLKERRTDQELAKPVIGKGNRWLLNMRNSDGTRVEFTEAQTVR